MPLCFVRIMKFASVGDIGAMSMHARGLGALAQHRREKREAEIGQPVKDRCITLNAEGKLHLHPVGAPAIDLSMDLKSHLEKTGASVWKDSAHTLHCIVGVSPEWITEAGDPHSPKNYRVQGLLREARAWAEKEIGGVWHARYDVDELGAGVVDVMCSPVLPHKKTGKLWVSTSKALESLARRWGHPTHKSYSAVQDSWAEHAKKTLDATIERGEPVEETGRSHLTPEQYGELKDRERELAERESQVEQGAQILDQREAKLNGHASQLRDYAERLNADRRRLAALVGREVSRAAKKSAAP